MTNIQRLYELNFKLNLFILFREHAWINGPCCQTFLHSVISLVTATELLLVPDFGSFHFFSSYTSYFISGVWFIPSFPTKDCRVTWQLLHRRLNVQRGIWYAAPSHLQVSHCQSLEVNGEISRSWWVTLKSSVQAVDQTSAHYILTVLVPLNGWWQNLRWLS